MNIKEATKIVGSEWIEWFSDLDPELKRIVIETQIGFAIVYGREGLRDVFETIKANIS